MSQSPQASDGDKSSDGESVQSGSSPSTSRLVVSGSPSRQLKRVHRKTKSSLEGAKRRGSTKRASPKLTGSFNMTPCNAGEYELTEVTQYEGRIHLPSPFLVWAIQLPFHGSLPRSERGFSLAVWICLTCPNLGSEYDGERSHASCNSPGRFGNAAERMMLARRERFVHLCSVGSGKSLFEVWTAPSDESVLVR